MGSRNPGAESKQSERRRKPVQDSREDLDSSTPTRQTMKTLIFIAFLAAATVCLCHADDDAHSSRANDSPGSEAFVSRRESAEVVKRPLRNYNRWPNAVAAQVATPDPFEAHREVCEMNPACDELADHIGFHEAYRRFYGPI